MSSASRSIADFSKICPEFVYVQLDASVDVDDCCLPPIDLAYNMSVPDHDYEDAYDWVVRLLD